MAQGGSACHLMANNMPLSDNNVSTTNMALTNTWDNMESEQDINVSFFSTTSSKMTFLKLAIFILDGCGSRNWSWNG